MGESLTYHLILVILPLIISGSLHMIIIKNNAFSYLAHPISEGLFGANKTWRGVILMPLLNGILLWLLNLIFNLEVDSPFFIGAVLGFAYILFELPNSFIKRRLGIKPGEDSKTHKYLFRVIDRLDSSIGVAIAYYLITPYDLKIALAVLILGVLIHYIISLALVKLSIKKSL